MMTGMERVGAALEGRFADSRVTAPLLSLYGRKFTGVTTERHYREASTYAAGQRAVTDRFDPDILFGPFALALEAEAYGAGLDFPESGPPNVRKPTLPVRDLDLVKPEDSDGLSYLVESVREIAATSRGERPVAAPVCAPTDFPALLFGIDAWLEALLFDSETATALLDFAERHFIALAGELFKAGAAFVVLPIMFANPAILTDRLIETLTVPALRKAFAACPGPIVFHHGANPLAARVELFRDLPNVVGFVLDERDSSRTARAKLGDAPLILAGPSGPNMRRRTPEAVTASVESILRDNAADPRFALVTCAADVPVDTEPETVDAFMTASRGYPHG